MRAILRFYSFFVLGGTPLLFPIGTHVRQHAYGGGIVERFKGMHQQHLPLHEMPILTEWSTLAKEACYLRAALLEKRHSTATYHTELQGLDYIIER